MPKKRIRPEQIEAAARRGAPVALACKDAGICQQTYDRWRKDYGGMGVGQARKLKLLEDENARLKKLVADLSLEKQVFVGPARWDRKRSVRGVRMSALGQKQTFEDAARMSALPPKADILGGGLNVR